MEIIYKDKNVIVINKPIGVPSESDVSGDKDAMLLLKEELVSIGENNSLWLVHRLDRVVGGLMVFARNKRAAAELSAMVAKDGIGKEYLAVAGGILTGGVMQDYVYRDAPTKKAYVVKNERKGAKFAELEYEVLDALESDTKTHTLVGVKLHTGRFHQIRVQFASRGHSLLGDKKYGSRDAFANHPALYAYKLDFALFGKRISCLSKPNTDLYPWSEFKDKINSL